MRIRGIRIDGRFGFFGFLGLPVFGGFAPEGAPDAGPGVGVGGELGAAGPGAAASAQVFPRAPAQQRAQESAAPPEGEHGEPVGRQTASTPGRPLRAAAPPAGSARDAAMTGAA